MTEILGGLLMAAGGGSMTLGSIIYLARSSGPSAAELVAALPFTPVPRPDADLDQLVASID